MPVSRSDDPDVPPNPETLDADALVDIDQWLEKLRRSDRSLYNLMALEVWSLAQTMDSLVPGFWSRFMENRQIALKQFVQLRKTQRDEAAESGKQGDEGMKG